MVKIINLPRSEIEKRKARKIKYWYFSNFTPIEHITQHYYVTLGHRDNNGELCAKFEVDDRIYYYYNCDKIHLEINGKIYENEFPMDFSQMYNHNFILATDGEYIYLLNN